MHLFLSAPDQIQSVRIPILRLWSHSWEYEASLEPKLVNPNSKPQVLFERLWRYNTVSAMATVDSGALETIAAEVGMVLKNPLFDWTIDACFCADSCLPEHRTPE